MSFNPFTYDPQTGSYFGYSEKHESAIAQFMTWLQSYAPDAYAELIKKRPDLVHPQEVIITGSLSVPPSKLQGLADGTATDTGAATQWGQDLLNFFQQALPAYYQAQSQKAILDINVQRAEQGLAPIDPGSIAPQVNVGVSTGVTTLGYVAVGAFVLYGITKMFHGRNRA